MMTHDATMPDSRRRRQQRTKPSPPLGRSEVSPSNQALHLRLSCVESSTDARVFYCLQMMIRCLMKAKNLTMEVLSTRVRTWNVLCPRLFLYPLDRFS